MNQKVLRRIKRQDQMFNILGIVVIFSILGLLIYLVADLFKTGWPQLSWLFFSSYPSRFFEKAGILSALVGTFSVISLTALVAIPIGIAAAMYLEEIAQPSFFSKMIDFFIQNLAGVPSIIHGLIALSLFVIYLNWGQSILTAALALSFLILPIIIVSTREALKTVPQNIREASFALGSTQIQTLFWHVLPYSFGGILTGIIVAISRAIGETAPLVTVGALTYIAFLPQSIFDPYTVLPIQVFNWLSRPQQEFHVNAAAAGVVLIIMTLSLNAVAIILRYSFRKKYKW